LVNPSAMRVLLVSLVLTIWLVGCSGADPDNLRPWEKRDQSGSDTPRTKDYGSKLEEGKPYVVVKGDTLYSIAFRLGIDFRELAARNGIQSPYIIKVGQTLRTAKPAVKSVKVTPKPVVKAPKVAVKASSPSKNTNKSAPKQAKVTSVTKPSSKTQASSDNVNKSQAVSRWRWPSAGKVVRTYSSNRHKGIDIGGKRGDPVRAVAAGKVVYAGTGVTGYGSLLIIKHNDTYLSAYGHNERLLVSENMNIQAGQQIATMGSSGTDTVKLHFELRRRGQPIDPLTLLPRRR
jgi:lipoprotein NlpD